MWLTLLWLRWLWIVHVPGRLWYDRRGQALVEYVILLVIVVVIVGGALLTLHDTLGSKLLDYNDAL